MGTKTVTLDVFLKSAKVGEFKPLPIYEKHTDSLIFYCQNFPSYGKRLNSLVTVFLADSDDRLVGLEIKGVARILRRVKGFLNVTATDGKSTISLSVLLACACAGRRR